MPRFFEMACGRPIIASLDDWDEQMLKHHAVCADCQAVLAGDQSKYVPDRFNIALLIMRHCREKLEEER